jgi:uncharacterized cupin superfamily protein
MAVKRVNGITYTSLNEPEFIQAPDYAGEDGDVYQGRVWEIDRSADGRRSIALFEQTGELDYEYSCGEVVIVQKGWISCTFEDGQVVTLNEGDVAYFEKGVKGHFKMSEDFSDLAVFISDDKPVDII